MAKKVKQNNLQEYLHKKTRKAADEDNCQVKSTVDGQRVCSVDVTLNINKVKRCE